MSGAAIPPSLQWPQSFMNELWFVMILSEIVYCEFKATKRLDFYERITSPIFVAFLIIGSWLIGFMGTVLIFHCELFKQACLTSNFIAPFTVVVSISIGTSFIIFVGVVSDSQHFKKLILI